MFWGVKSVLWSFWDGTPSLARLVKNADPSQYQPAWKLAIHGRRNRMPWIAPVSAKVRPPTRAWLLTTSLWSRTGSMYLVGRQTHPIMFQYGSGTQCFNQVSIQHNPTNLWCGRSMTIEMQTKPNQPWWNSCDTLAWSCVHSSQLLRRRSHVTWIHCNGWPYVWDHMTEACSWSKHPQFFICFYMLVVYRIWLQYMIIYYWIHITHWPLHIFN